MKKISNDNNFENYLNTYVNVEVNGVVKKFFVSEINSGSIVTDAGILYNYTTLGESTIQDCDVCEKTCFNNIPIIELNFYGKGRYTSDYKTSSLINNKINETHDIFINNNKVCRLDTKDLSANVNRLWLIPYYSSNVQIPNFFDDGYTGYSYTTAASCVFFNPLFYNKRNWNSLTIKPISAYNPSTLPQYTPQYFYTNFYGDVSTSLTRDESGILTNKILVNSSNVSSVSCIPWQQYFFSWNNYIDNSCYTSINNCPYLSSDLVLGTNTQQVTTFFIDLDPCQNPTEYGLGFTYDGTRYYTDSSAYKFAYDNLQPPDPYFGAPSLRKYIFYTDCLKTNTVEVYNGRSNTGLYGSPIYYSDLGITPFNGFLYYSEFRGGPVIRGYEYVNGISVGTEYNCP